MIGERGAGCRIIRKRRLKSQYTRVGLSTALDCRIMQPVKETCFIWSTVYVSGFDPISRVLLCGFSSDLLHRQTSSWIVHFCIYRTAYETYHQQMLFTQLFWLLYFHTFTMFPCFTVSLWGHCVMYIFSLGDMRLLPKPLHPVEISWDISHHPEIYRISIISRAALV